MVESSSINAAGDGDNSALGAEIAELERQLMEERDRVTVEQSQAEVARFVARQEAEKCRRECSALQDRVAILEEECRMLSEREAKYRERNKRLMEEIEAKGRDFQEKFIEMKVEIRDLDCAKNRAIREAATWKKRCGELVEENSRLKGVVMVAAAEVGGEMPRRNEGQLLTPERKRSSEFLGVGRESESMGEDGCGVGGGEDEGILPHKLKKSRVAEVGDGAGKDSGCGEPCTDGDAEPAGTRNTEPIGISGDAVAPQIPLVPATGEQEVCRFIIYIVFKHYLL